MKGIIILLAAIAAHAQTRLNFDQASKLNIYWSDGVGSPRISRVQVRTPALTFTSDPTGLVISGDRNCKVTMHPGRTILLYVMWVKGKLAILAGGFEWAADATNSDKTKYFPTLDHVDIAGDCVPVETGGVDGRLLTAGAQEILFVGTAGMPQATSTFLGVCVNSFGSYSLGYAGLMSVLDLRGQVNSALTTCGR